MALDDSEEIGDEALLVLFAGGDAEAAALLTRRFTPVVLAHAYRLLGDRAEAEDIAQEAMMKLWKIAPEWRQGEAKVTTWLYRVTANACTDRFRRRARAAPLDDAPEPLDEAPGAEARLQEASRGDALNAALAALPERQRQAVLLRHIEGLANPEIAEIMQLSIDAVESLTARGKRKLADILRKRQEELGYDIE